MGLGGGGRGLRVEGFGRRVEGLSILGLQGPGLGLQGLNQKEDAVNVVNVLCPAWLRQLYVNFPDLEVTGNP